MKAAEDSLVDEAARRLKVAAPNAQVILFGSRARGDARAESDLDLLVIQAKTASPRSEFVRLRSALRGLGVPIDLILMSTEDAERWRDMPGTMVNEAMREGRVLAAA